MSAQEIERTLGELKKQAKALEARIVARKRLGEDAGALIAEHCQLSSMQKELRAQLDADPVESLVPPVAPAAPALSAQMLTGDEQFAALRREWHDLLSRTSVRSAFNTWEWLYPWWRIYGADKRLRLITVRDASGVLVGLAPLMLGKGRRGKRGIALRRLGFIGTGEGPLADDLTFPVDESRKSEVTAAVWHQCEEMSADWDTMELDEICPTDDILVEFQRSALQKEYLAIGETLRLSVYGDLPASFESYVASVQHQSRRNYLRSLPRRLAREYQRVEYARCDATGETSVHLRELALLSIERFSRKRSRSVWEDSAASTCISDAAAYMAEEGWLRLHALRVDGRTAAMVLGFAVSDTYQCFQPTFDVSLEAMRPLHCLLGECIAGCISEGIVRFDFLAGEHAYKTEYFEGRKPVGRLTICRAEPSRLVSLGLQLYLQGCRRIARRWLRRSGGASLRAQSE